MPDEDGTGPVGQDRFGIGQCRGGNIASGAGFAGPDSECRCPNCGYHKTHHRGIFCNTKKCPKCSAQMIRT